MSRVILVRISALLVDQIVSVDAMELPWTTEGNQYVVRDHGMEHKDHAQGMFLI